MPLRRHSLMLFLWLCFVSLAGAAETPETDSDFFRIDTVLLPDKRSVCLGVGNGTGISINEQILSNGTWTGWQVLAGEEKFKDVRGLLCSDKKLAAFALNRNGQIWFNRQTGSDDQWTGWKPVGNVVGFNRIEPASNLDGRLTCFALGDGLVWGNSQTSINGRWSGWKRLPGVSGISHLRSKFRPDGKLELYVIGLRSGSWVNQQMPSGEWSNWQSNPNLPLRTERGKRREGPAIFYASATGALTVFRWASIDSTFSMLATNEIPKGYSLHCISNHVVAADVNGDGRTDNVAAYQYTGGTMRLHVFLNGGVYQGPRGWFQSGTFEMAKVDGRMVAGDFNGDGNDDIAMFYDTGGGLRIFRFLSTGSSFTHDVTNLNTYDISQMGENVASADVNGDGRMDIIAARQMPNGTMRLHIFDHGNSFMGENGWWQSSLDMTKVAGRMTGGDFDGNGKGDVLMFYDTGGGVKIIRFLSNGTSFITDSVSIPAGYNLSQVGSRLGAGDVNGDGLTDAIAAYQYPNNTVRLHVFLNGNSYLGPEGWYQSEQFDLAQVEGRLTIGQWQAGTSLPPLSRATNEP